jgi:hypothetical protein
MNVEFKDWVDLIRVSAWPGTVALALIILRRPLSQFLGSLGQRVKKLSIFQFALELSALPEFTPKWSAPSLSDVRQLSPADEFSSQATSLLDRLRNDSASDYAVIDLGGGQQWLTSRLFIFAVLLERMRGLRCFVFVETTGETRRRFIGLAAPEGVRWGLARRYPWLEKAFASAYSQLPNFQIQSNHGALESWQAIQLVQKFLKEIQKDVPESDPQEWTSLGTQPLWEHAKWLDGSRLERVLHDFLDVSSMPESPDMPPTDRAKAALRRGGALVALVGADGRFKTLIDRQALLEKLGERFVASFDHASSSIQ